MSLLYLIRHAATERVPNVDPARWTLSDEGFLAAVALAGRRFWPQIGRVVTSTERKTLATVAPAAEMWRLPTESRAAFDEVRRGSYVEDYEAAARAFFADPSHPPEGWEPATAARERVVAGLEALLQEYPGQNLALVGHGLLWSLLRAHLLGHSPVDADEWRAIQMPDISVWQWEAGDWRLRQDFEGLRRRDAGCRMRDTG